ncbi:hypothetical protein BD413DRAFT_151949 [Trametes elegans]|nr:hypothetical protein BD413DRAFT_151949 [Trametes elegans]
MPRMIAYDPGDECVRGRSRTTHVRHSDDQGAHTVGAFSLRIRYAEPVPYAPPLTRLRRRLLHPISQQSRAAHFSSRRQRRGLHDIRLPHDRFGKRACAGAGRARMPSSPTLPPFHQGPLRRPCAHVVSGDLASAHSRTRGSVATRWYAKETACGSAPYSTGYDAVQAQHSTLAAADP